MPKHHDRRSRAIAPLLVAFAGLTLCPVAAQAQDAPFRLQDAIGSDRLKIDGSFRTRFEGYDGGYRPGGTDSSHAMLLQTIIRAEYQGDGFRIGGQIEDARAYWRHRDTPLGNGEINALELVQLYLAVDLTRSVQIKGGNMLIDLGSKRLVGNPGFRNAANGFTGLRGDWSGPGRQHLTLFYTLPQQRLPSDIDGTFHNRVVMDRASWDQRFWGAFYSRGAIGPFTLETYVFGLDENDAPGRPTRNRHLVTPGGRLYTKKAPGRWDAEIEGAWQGGTIRASTAATAAQRDVDAYTVHAEAGYTIKAPWQPRLVAFGDIASGDKASSRSYNRFDPLYGPRRGDWGPTELYGPLGRSNIRNLGARLEVQPGKRLDAFVEWRKLWLDSATDSFSYTKVLDRSGLSGRDGGSQMQARVRYWLLPKQVRLELGGAILAKGHFLRHAPNSPDFGATHYGYGDLTFQF